MLSNIGIPGLILIVIFALIVFGPKKLPELGKSMGRTLKEFKSATKGITGDDEVTVTTADTSAATSETTATPVTATASKADHVVGVSEAVTDKV